MSWARFDDAYCDHPKIVTAGVMAELLDIRGILYSCRLETDGKIPKALLPLIGRGISRPGVQVKKLVEVGRWIETDDGWEIVDFLSYNASRADREKEREKARERMSKARNGKGSSPEHPPNTARSSPDVPITGSSGNPVPSRPMTVNSSVNSKHAEPVENPAPTDEKQIEQAVLEHIADNRLKQANGVQNRTRYRDKILTELANEIDLPRLRRIIGGHRADTPIEMLASAALGEPTPYLGQYRRTTQEVSA